LILTHSAFGPSSEPSRSRWAKVQADEANISVELKADIGKYIFDVSSAIWPATHYLEWVLNPSDLHTPGRCRHYADGTV
jgi:hypothetical protein